MEFFPSLRQQTEQHSLLPVWVQSGEELLERPSICSSICSFRKVKSKSWCFVIKSLACVVAASAANKTFLAWLAFSTAASQIFSAVFFRLLIALMRSGGNL